MVVSGSGNPGGKGLSAVELKKKKSQGYSDEPRTLDEEHTKKKNQFIAKNTSTKDLQEKLAVTENILNKCKVRIQQGKNVESNKLERTHLLQEIDELKQLIRQSRDRSEELMYTLRNGSTLSFYYGIDKMEVADREELFDDYLKESGKKFGSEKTVISKENRGCKSHMKGIVFKIWNENNNPQRKDTVCNYNHCDGLIENFHNEGIVGCNKCGRCVGNVTIITGKLTKKDYEGVNSVYKRINHFNEIMSQIQAQEKTSAEQIIEKVIDQMNEDQIDKEDLSYFSLKVLLKKLDLCRAYEHAAYILEKINGKRPPKFTTIQVSLIRQRFIELQLPFELFKPPERQNFLNYSYSIHKICESLGYTEFLDYFPLLKNPGKLIAHDKIWEQCCGYREWEYIKSI